MTTGRRPYSRHLSDLLREQTAAAPDRPVVIAGDRTLTYAELDAVVDGLAAGLAGLGLGPGGTLGLLCTNRWEWVATALAAMRLGATVATFNTFAKAWDLDYMLGHSEVEILVLLDGYKARDYLETLSELVPELGTQALPTERFPRLREVVVIGDRVPEGAIGFSSLQADGAPPAPPVGSAADDAFVLYTSGSSARPKAVPLQQYGVVENGFAIGERMGLTDADRVWVSIPLFWAYGATNALPATLTHGGALVLQESFEPGEALDLIEAHGATAAYTLPNITGALLGHPDFAPQRTQTLERGLTLGPPAELRRTAEVLGITAISNIYGGTETYGNCCVTPSTWPLERRAECQGPPLPGVSLRVLGEDGSELPPGEVGELHVRGYITRGYRNDTSGAGAAFGEDGWFRTGDLAHLDAEGCVHFAARATEMIKTGGINVAPREVEEFLALRDDVADVAVIGAPDERMGEVVVAFVVPVAGTAPTAEELRAFCKERIAMFKVPARVHVVGDLPKTDTGKLARRELLERDVAREEIS
ncbi:AMP-binding protein [Baekduia soli]|uniref:AMP-binding protein n=1 Tax=Baekduia soli TaxID=496014 RepID=A0A5B8U9L6_9ACTN|nr:AMP-binding protein [Baekduia soli]QEC49715.1 AMP-binding protein [Baekduia soli]